MLTSVFVRADCGCVVLPLGRRHPAHPQCEEVVLLWNCERDGGYLLAESMMAAGKIERGRALALAEEKELVGQLRKRVTAGAYMRHVTDALSAAASLNRGRTDASPCKDT